MPAALPISWLQADLYEFYSDFSNMALYGTVLGWFVGVTDLERFRWLFSRWAVEDIVGGLTLCYV